MNALVIVTIQITHCAPCCDYACDICGRNIKEGCMKAHKEYDHKIVEEQNDG